MIALPSAVNVRTMMSGCRARDPGWSRWLAREARPSCVRLDSVSETCQLIAPRNHGCSVKSTLWRDITECGTCG